jgi:hypothetical protein
MKAKPISAKERHFDFDNYNMSIAPDYTGADLIFGFKKGSQHFRRHIRNINM